MHYSPDRIQFFVNEFFRLEDDLIGHHNVCNGQSIFTGITDQIPCRLVGIRHIFLRRLRVLFHAFRKLGVLFLSSHHKASANGIKASFVEKLIACIRRKVHGIGVEGRNLVGSKGNVPFRIEGDRKLAIQHQF